jgi:plasmid stabilization system protein ParE
VKVRILEPAKADLINGFHFYEDQEPGAGRYFLNNLYSDIEGLATTYGIHRQPFGDFHRAISKKFPYAIFYSVREYEIWVEAVIDCRKNPSWIRSKIRKLERKDGAASTDDETI